jgi:Fe-S cluster assembly protein SufD
MTLAALFEDCRRDREAWRYTDLAPLQKFAAQDCAASASYVYPDALSEAHFVRFLDGRIVEGAVEKDGVVALRLGKEQKRVEIQYALSGAVCEAATKIKLIVEADADVVVIERFLKPADEGAGIEVPESEILLEKNAKASFVKTIEGGNAAYHFAKTKAALEDNAALDVFVLSAGRALARNDLRVALKGDGASVKLRGLMLVDGKRQADAVCSIAHEAMGTKSDAFFKSVLRDKARGVFLGKIRVAPHAQNTEAYQLSRALLLSDQAEMDSKPELEIEADDVKCGHGSAVGDLDEAALFFLRARGIPEDEAREVLIAAFVDEMIEGITDEAARDAVRCVCRGTRE